MTLTRRSLLGTVGTGIAAGLAGCGGGNTGNGGDGGDGSTNGDGGSDGSDGGSDGDGGGSSDDGGGMASATVAVESHPDHGDILVDGDGMTLYMFDSDTKGESASTCYDQCADAWPPFTTGGTPEAGEGVSAELTTFEREGGDRQVAAAGWPLYYFDSDEEPGDANGQGANDVWWVLAPDGTPRTPSSGGSGGASDGESDGGGGPY